MIIFPIAFLVGFILLYRTIKNENRALAAMHRWCNIGEIFHELRADPFMTTAKWKDLLPLFEEADQRFAETHRYIKKFTPYADLVRREIGYSSYEEVDSS